MNTAPVLEEPVDQLLRRYRKRLLADPVRVGESVSIDRSAIERIVPHRDPLLWLDAIERVDLSSGTLVARRTIPSDDPVFRGHFPDFPVYPGTFLIEMVGQLGVCLQYFLNARRHDVPPDATYVPLRATKIFGAHFMEPVFPGETVHIIGQRLNFDGILGTLIGQVISRNKVCCVTAGEICFLG